MRKLWLVFAQTATICLAAYFVVVTLRPDLLPGSGRGGIVTIREPHADGAAQKVPPTMSEAARKAMPSVVNIFTSKEVKVPRNPLLEDPVFRRFFGDQVDPEVRRAASLGSGVIVSPEGYILTNNHVVEAADEIEVALADGRKVEAKAVGADPETDLAVLKIELKDLPAITFGQSDQARVGDFVLAIGNPFAVGQTVTFGIISGLGRSHLGISTFENFIQTDAAINPGNSGGALVDVNGNLIGINSAIYSRTGGNLGIGFATPVSLARHVMEQIIQTGSVTRGWIGVEAQEISRELAVSFKLRSTDGALIAGVLRDGPADKAGVRLGDILIAVDGKSVVDPTSMLNLVAGLSPGRDATLTVLRGQGEVRLNVTVGKRPKPVKSE